MSLHYLCTCACAQPLQACPILQPHGLQPTGLLCPWVFSRQEYWSGLPCPPPWDLPNPGIEPRSLMSPALAGQFFTTSATGKALYMHISSVQSLSRVQLFAIPWTIAYQAPLSMGFPRHEYWSGLPFPSPMHESEVKMKVKVKQLSCVELLATP